MVARKKGSAKGAKASKAAKPKKASKAAAKSSDDTQIAAARDHIKAAGKEGISAEVLGRKLGLIKKSQDASQRSSALKKVRVLARKATGGATPKRDGRTAIYVM